MGGTPIPAIFGGAVQQTIEELSNEFTNRGHKVTVIVATKEIYKEELEKSDKKNVNYEYVYISGDTLFSWIKRISLSIKKVIDNRPYDVINLHVPHWAMIFKLLSPLIGKPKIIWHIHNCSKFAFVAKLARINIVGISKSVISVNGRDLFDKRVALIPNIARSGFPLVSEQSRINARKKFEILENHFVIGFAGRISHEKGLHVIFEAIDKLTEDEKRDIVIIIAGSSWFKNAEISEYEKSIYTRSKNYNIRILGYVDNWELYKVYHACDLFIVPSTWEEPAGQVVVEAQSCGTHVIASKIGGIPEYLSPFETTFNAGDYNDLAVKIVRCVNDKSKRTTAISEMRANWINEKFGLEKVVNNWLKLYKK